MPTFRLAALFVLFVSLYGGSAAAGGLIELKPFAAGVKKPVALGALPGVPGTICAAESAGRIVCLTPTSESDTKPLLELPPQLEIQDKRTLLSFAFHPEYQSNRKLFISSLYYGESTGSRLAVSELIRKPSKGGGGWLGEREVFSLRLKHKEYTAGSLAFGPQGMLFIALPDGGGALDPKETAQNLQTLFGTIIRIDPLQGETYLPPLDNPFVMDDKGLREIYAYGFHNPVGLSFDRKAGTLWSVDRGHNAFEEVNIVEPRKNYGWSIYEGTQCQRMKFECLNASYAKPVHAYSHGVGQAVVSGFVYRGKDIPAIEGMYVFTDPTAMAIWALESVGGRYERKMLLETETPISVLGEDAAGELYAADYQSGKLFAVHSGSAPAKAPAKAPLTSGP